MRITNKKTFQAHPVPQRVYYPRLGQYQGSAYDEFGQMEGAAFPLDADVAAKPQVIEEEADFQGEEVDPMDAPIWSCPTCLKSFTPIQMVYHDCEE